jgi:hypothetical protein
MITFPTSQIQNPVMKWTPELGPGIAEVKV